MALSSTTIFTQDTTTTLVWADVATSGTEHWAVDSLGQVYYKNDVTAVWESMSEEGFASRLSIDGSDLWGEIFWLKDVSTL